MERGEEERRGGVERGVWVFKRFKKTEGGGLFTVGLFCGLFCPLKSIASNTKYTGFTLTRSVVEWLGISGAHVGMRVMEGREFGEIRL